MKQIQTLPPPPQKKHRHLEKLFVLCFALLVAASGSCMFSKPVSAATPKLSKTKVSLAERKTITLTVKKAAKKVVWKSSNTGVVRITRKSGARNSKATLKGIKAGKAKITAKVGSKRLTANITVKHVHKWRGYATCTSKDTCRTCGARRGNFASHDWLRICQRPETCSVCGQTRGAKLEHEWGSNNRCRMCNLRNLHKYMNIWIPTWSVGEGDLMYFNMTTNTNLSTIVYANDAQGYGTATAYDASHRQLKRLIAWEDGAAAPRLQLTGGAGNYTFCMRSSDFGKFRFPSDGSIEFELWFDNEHFLISVKCSNTGASNYTYTPLR